MSISIATSGALKLAGMATLGIGIMWALQMLGFGPTWIISAAASVGASAGIVYIAGTLRGGDEEPAGFHEIA